MKEPGKRKFLASFLAVILLFSAFPSSALSKDNDAVKGEAKVQLFNDVTMNHWAYDHIKDLLDKSIINGYSDGTFRPGETVTRAHAAVMIVNALGLDYKGKTPDFTDVSSEHWASGHIAAAQESGIINGYRDGTFKPGDNITRAHIAVMIANAFKVEHSGNYKDFPDVNEKYWAYKQIEILSSNGIINGYSDGSFKPAELTTRAHFSVILSNAIAKIDSSIEKVTNKYINSNFQDDYVNIEILPNNKFLVEGSTIADYKYVWIRIEDLTKDDVILHKIIEINDHKYNDEFVVPLVDGDYTFNAGFGHDWFGTGAIYTGVYSGIAFTYKDGLASFPKSVVYKNNLQKFNLNNGVRASHLEIDGLSKEDKSKLKNLAEDITRGISDNYQKTVEISKWVSSNIYYDFDSLSQGKHVPSDPISTLANKKSVCQGYAELTAALVKSAGIPARVVTGRARASYEKGFDEIDHSTANHAWNEAFVDGRWVIIDNTWNSDNVYENGEFIQGDTTLRYFDSKLEAFSNTHKIMYYW